VNRSQNRSESNDQKFAANDGGFVYRPGSNPPEYENGTSSYGGMTAAGLLSLLFAGVDKSDPRVQAAYKWMTANYTLELNPGTTKKHGLFYFYNAFAKVMSAYGEDSFTDGKGQKHNWRNELAQKLLSLQAADGSWANADSNAWWEDPAAARHRLVGDRTRASAQVIRCCTACCWGWHFAALRTPRRRRASTWW